MPRVRQPRRGSMQFWPRKRASSPHARIRTWHPAKEAKALGFAGYKAGMTHLIVTDNKATSATKGEPIVMPVTVVECPPLKVAGICCYRLNNNRLVLSTQVWADKPEKDLSRVLPIPKKTKTKITDIKPEEYNEFRLLVHTQPRLARIKKTPEVFEIGIGGTAQQQFEYAKNILGKDLKITDVFAAGQQVDSHSITKGKGLQGPVKRFGISIRSHKSEKTKRGPGALGPWHGNFNWPVAHAGQMGYHQRTESNKWIIQVGEDPSKINPAGGFVHYGLISSPYLLIKGSLAGSVARLVKFTTPMRPDKHTPKEAPSITHISVASKQ
ncbi:MAG: 50S ribosomal protein L3 [Candidatus Woesearchaeota archaeon]